MLSHRLLQWTVQQWEQRITPDGQTTTYHFNIQGSTVALTDLAGSITDSYAYDSFGVLANFDGDSPQPFRYLGRYGIVDDRTGLYHARARYFSPQLGRFLSKDPITGKDSDAQSLNRYVYALNNALRFIDPSGLTASEGRFNTYDPYAAEAAYWEAYNKSASWMIPYLRFLEGAGLVAGYTADVLTLGESALVRNAVRQVARNGPALARRLGEAGESAAAIIKNTERIPSLTGTASYRIPDVLDQAGGVIGEIKNVGSLSYSSQLRDFVAYAQQTGLRFELTVRPTTQLTGPLQEMISRGNIFLHFLPTP